MESYLPPPHGDSVPTDSSFRLEGFPSVHAGFTAKGANQSNYQGVTEHMLDTAEILPSTSLSFEPAAFHSNVRKGHIPSREVSFATTSPLASRSSKKKGWGGGIGRLFKRKHRHSDAPALGAESQDPDPSVYSTPNMRKKGNLDGDYESWSNADSRSGYSADPASGASGQPPESKHRRLRDFLRRRTNEGARSQDDEYPPSTARSQRSSLSAALGENYSDDEMYARYTAAKQTQPPVPQTSALRHNSNQLPPRQPPHETHVYDGSSSLNPPEPRRKKKSWYQKVFTGSSHKSKGDTNPSIPRTVSFVSSIPDDGGRAMSSSAASDPLGERLSFSGMPPARSLPSSPERISTSGLGAPTVKSASPLPPLRPEKAEERKKKKSSPFNIFKFKRSKSSKGSKTTGSSAHYYDGSNATYLQEDGRTDHDNGSEVHRVIITSEMIDEEERTRLAHLRNDTRDNFLEVLRDLKKQFFMQQGKHALWKYQSLSNLLARPLPLAMKESQISPDSITQAYQGSPEEIILKGERETAMLNEVLTQIEEEKRNYVEQEAQTYLKSYGELSRVAVEVVPGQTEIVDPKRVDWRLINTKQQVEAMKVSFLMSRMTHLIHCVFDSRDDLASFAALVSETDDQIQNWVSQGFLSEPNGTKLHGDDFKVIGQELQGKYLIQHLNMLLETAAKAASNTYYDDMVKLADDIELTRKHIYEVVDDAFEYLRSRLVSSTRKSFSNSQSPRNAISNEADAFILPGFVNNKLRLLSITNGKPSDYHSRPAKESPNDIRERQEALVRRLVAYQKQPVGEGLALTSDRLAMESMEKRMGGKWGSYKMYEKWLQDAIKWQWQDVATQTHLRDGAIALEALINEKKRQMKEIIDKKLTQLWKARATTAANDSVEMLSRYLSEAVEQRPAIFQTSREVDFERTAMASEDTRAHLTRIIEGPLGREIYKQSGHFKKKNGFMIKQADSVDNLISLLKEIKKLLDKDSSLLHDVEVQTIIEELQLETDRVWKTVATVQKERAQKQNVAEKKVEELEIKRKEAEALLQKERSAMDSIQIDEVVHEKQQELDQILNELEATKTRVTELVEMSRANKTKTKELEKEIKVSKKKLQEEQKKSKAIESSALQKHLEVESKKDKLQKILQTPSNHSSRPQSDAGGESIVEGERKKKTWLSKMLGTSSGKPRGSSSVVTESHSMRHLRSNVQSESPQYDFEPTPKSQILKSETFSERSPRIDVVPKFKYSPYSYELSPPPSAPAIVQAAEPLPAHSLKTHQTEYSSELLPTTNLDNRYPVEHSSAIAEQVLDATPFSRQLSTGANPAFRRSDPPMADNQSMKVAQWEALAPRRNDLSGPVAPRRGSMSALDLRPRAQDDLATHTPLDSTGNNRLMQRRVSVATGCSDSKEKDKSHHKSGNLWKKFIGGSGGSHAKGLGSQEDLNKNLKQQYEPQGGRVFSEADMSDASSMVDKSPAQREGSVDANMNMRMKKKKKGWGWLVGKGKSSRSQADKSVLRRRDVSSTRSPRAALSADEGHDHSTWKRGGSNDKIGGGYRRRSMEADRMIFTSESGYSAWTQSDPADVTAGDGPINYSGESGNIMGNDAPLQSEPNNGAPEHMSKFKRAETQGLQRNQSGTIIAPPIRLESSEQSVVTQPLPIARRNTGNLSSLQPNDEGASRRLSGQRSLDLAKINISGITDTEQEKSTERQSSSPKRDIILSLCGPDESSVSHKVLATAKASKRATLREPIVQQRGFNVTELEPIDDETEQNVTSVSHPSEVGTSNRQDPASSHLSYIATEPARFNTGSSLSHPGGSFDTQTDFIQPRLEDTSDTNWHLEDEGLQNKLDTTEAIAPPIHMHNDDDLVLKLPVTHGDSDIAYPVSKVGITNSRDSDDRVPPTDPNDISGIKTPSVKDLFQSQFEKDALPLLEDLLKRMNMTILLNREERRSLERHSSIRQVEPGQTIYKKGDDIRFFHFVRSGLAVQPSTGKILEKADTLFQDDIEHFVHSVRTTLPDTYNPESSDTEEAKRGLTPHGYSTQEPRPRSPRDIHLNIKLQQLQALIEEKMKAGVLKAPCDVIAKDEPCFLWQLEIAKLIEKIEVANIRTKLDLKRIMRGIAPLEKLTRDELSALVDHMEPQLLTTTLVFEKSKINNCIWIVWQGCLIVVDSDNERIDQYYYSDVFGAESFGVDRRPQLKCSPKVYPTVYFLITRDLLEKITNEPLETVRARQSQRNEDIPTILASLESVSAIGEDAYRKPKKGISGMVSASAKFLGMKHSSSEKKKVDKKKKSSGEKKKLSKSRSLKLKNTMSRESKSRFTFLD